MRRLLLLLLPFALVATGNTSLSADAARRPAEDPRRGLIYDGLDRRNHAHCKGAFALRLRDHRGLPVCTHGPDPAPEGVDVRLEPPVPPAATAQSAPATVPCTGNGTDAFRVHLIYARPSDRPDGYASWLPSFRQWAAEIDEVFNLSAAATGGVRHVRFVHDASCVPVVDNVVLSPRAGDTFEQMLSELRSLGYSRTDRKYLVWMDANRYCGIAQVYYDDRPGQENYSNGHPQVPGEVGRVDKGCWGNLSQMVEVHELVHLLGGVQTSAPNATYYNHCRDEYDRLCYQDGGAFGGLTYLCPVARERLLDCNNDDYYSTSPPPGSYLDRYWNTANNRFLTATGSPPPTTTTTTTVPPTTTTTRPHVTTTTMATTTTTMAPTTTTTRPPTTTTTAPPTTTTTTAPPAGPPGTPGTLYASQPSTGPGVVLQWTPPAGSQVTGYRIYRGASYWNLSPLTTVGPTTTHLDTATTPGALYWYYVTALNGSAESAPSNFTRMIAR